MDKGFNSEAVPNEFVHCFNHQCIENKKCMRYLVATSCTLQYPIIRIVNQACVPENGNSCTLFLPIRKLRMAWGISNMFDNLPYKKVTGVRAQLISHLGRTAYYRVYRKERGLTPQEQDIFNVVFEDKGIKEKPTFEYYTEDYQWY